MPDAQRITRRRLTRSARIPAGSSASAVPSSSRPPASPARKADPVTAKVTSGNANMLTWVPSSLMVWPVQRMVKSWFLRRSRKPDICAT